MPIKPENRHRYPADWPQIRQRILQRACNRCEHVDNDGIRCTAKQYAVGLWRTGLFMPIQRAGKTWKEGRQLAAEVYEALGGEGDWPTVIVLTIAHLDHQPENCDPNNLRAMCQRHHLAHDHEHHQRNAAATRDAKRGQERLPL